MIVTSHLRGHVIEWFDGDWYYSDTGDKATVERPCIRCGRLPTPEGYDACLGYIPGAESACCGHGVDEPFVIMKSSIPGDEIAKL